MCVYAQALSSEQKQHAYYFLTPAMPAAYK